MMSHRYKLIIIVLALFAAPFYTRRATLKSSCRARPAALFAIAYAAFLDIFRFA